jgi:hypothetical protein
MPDDKTQGADCCACGRFAEGHTPCPGKTADAKAKPVVMTEQLWRLAHIRLLQERMARASPPHNISVFGKMLETLPEDNLKRLIARWSSVIELGNLDADLARCASQIAESDLTKDER